MKTIDYSTMGKVELRAACKEAGIKGYGNMNNEAMRAELHAKQLPSKPSALTSIISPVKPVQHKADSKTMRVVDGKKVSNAPAHTAPKERVKKEKAPAPVLPKVDRKGYKIQGEREVRNGVKRPSEGTLCHTMWTLFDSHATTIRANQLNDIADANQWDRITISCQFYTWRKFMGIKGRQK